MLTSHNAKEENKTIQKDSFFSSKESSEVYYKSTRPNVGGAMTLRITTLIVMALSIAIQ